MRTVVLYLSHRDERDVSAALDRLYTPDDHGEWADLADDSDAYLYIQLVKGIDADEYEPEHLASLSAHFDGKHPPLRVIADVSGRHPGDAQALRFAQTLLAQFGGVADDGCADGFWTLEEIQAGRRGVRFFDYQRSYQLSVAYAAGNLKK